MKTTKSFTWPRLLVVLLLFTTTACGSNAATGSNASTSSGPSPVNAPGDLLEDGVLTIGTNFEYPPYEYKDENGNQAGVDFELGKEIAKTLGLKPKFVSLTFDSLLPSVQTGKIDIALSWLYVNKQRATAIDFVPYATAGYGLVVKSDSTYTPTKPTDLCGHSLGAGLTTPLVNYVKPDSELGKQCPSDQGVGLKSYGNGALQLMFGDVIASRVEAVAGDAGTLTYYATQVPDLKDKIKTTLAPGDLFFPASVGIGVRKGKTEMNQAIQNAVNHLTKSGTLPSLLKDYGVGPARQDLFEDVLAGRDVPLFLKTNDEKTSG